MQFFKASLALHTLNIIPPYLPPFRFTYFVFSTKDDTNCGCFTSSVFPGLHTALAPAASLNTSARSRSEWCTIFAAVDLFLAFHTIYLLLLNILNRDNIQFGWLKF